MTRPVESGTKVAAGVLTAILALLLFMFGSYSHQMDASATTVQKLDTRVRATETDNAKQDERLAALHTQLDAIQANQAVENSKLDTIDDRLIAHMAHEDLGSQGIQGVQGVQGVQGRPGTPGKQGK